MRKVKNLPTLSVPTLLAFIFFFFFPPRMTQTALPVNNLVVFCPLTQCWCNTSALLVCWGLVPFQFIDAK